jgi:hypothetical protein
MRMDKMDRIKQVLSDQTKDELVEFLLDLASEYEEVKRRIELNFNADPYLHQ